jgi:acyl-[acyl-carrier-protein]-phospholipid O-acyltransferase/long-chain-fatty-acid--[acyl-carrier-protein] ligase
VVLHTRQEITPEDLWTKLNQTDLPKLWIPKKENLYRVEAIPVLGTGKVDLKKVKAIAMEIQGGEHEGDRPSLSRSNR